MNNIIKMLQGEITDYKIKINQIRSVLNRFNPFCDYTIKDFSDALQEISEIIENVEDITEFL